MAIVSLFARVDGLSSGGSLGALGCGVVGVGGCWRLGLPSPSPPPPSCLSSPWGWPSRCLPGFGSAGLGRGSSLFWVVGLPLGFGVVLWGFQPLAALTNGSAMLSCFRHVGAFSSEFLVPFGDLTSPVVVERLCVVA